MDMDKTRGRFKRFSGITRLLKGYSVTVTDLAEIIGCSRSTACRRINEPETLTLEEVDLIIKSGRVPEDELMYQIRPKGNKC